MLSFLLNQIWIGRDDILLNFFTTFSSVLGLQVAVLIRVSQLPWDCLLCLFKCWACLWPAKQVCSIVYHVIKVTELDWHWLIQTMLPTGIYIYQIWKFWYIFLNAWYIKFWFGIYSMQTLVCIWYGLFLTEALVETLNQCVCYLTKRKQRNRMVVKMCLKKFSDLAYDGSKRVSGKQGRKRAELGFRYTILVTQCIQSWECCAWEWQKI